MVTRTVEVGPERLVGWFDRYATTHPGATPSYADGVVRVDSGAGSTVVMAPLVPFAPGDDCAPGELIAALAAYAAAPVVTAMILVRRGGYAVGVARGPELLVSKVGTRYVQSRTAAGGWSQQRFARRREGQAKELVRAAAAAWTGLGAAPTPAVLVTGGDRALCDAVLAEPGLRRVVPLGVARHLDLPDPRLVVLRDAAVRAQALLVTISDP